MKLRNKFIALLSVATMLTLSACGGNTNTANQNNNTQATQTEQKATEQKSTEQKASEQKTQDGKRVVIDTLGELTVPQESKRIATTAAAHWTSVALLGASDKLVALEEGYGKNKWVVKKFPQWANLPVVFASNKANMEELLKTEPDLVIYATRYGEDFRKQLEDLKISYICDPKEDENFTFLNRVKAKLVYYGDAIGGISSDIAKEYAKDFDEMYNKINEKTSKLEDSKKKTILAVTSADPITIINGSSIGQEWMTLAGGINVAKDATGDVGTSGRLNVSMEQVLQWNPSYLIVDSKDIKEAIEKDSAWAKIDAVKNKNILIMPKGLMPWGYHGPEEYLMMPFIAKSLQPELFADFDLEQMAKDFYKKYYKIDLDEEDIKYLFSK